MTHNVKKESIHGINVILVDDNVSFRSALKKLLKIQYGCNIIAEASNGEEFLALTNHCMADVIIMDLVMPKMDGQAATKIIGITHPYLKIIAVTMHYEKAYLTELIHNGFKGCIFKNYIYEKITEAILVVINGGYYFPEDIKKEFIK